MNFPSLPFDDPFLLSSFFGAALIVGLSKAGIKGVVMFSVVLLATAFGGRESTGLLVPMFIVGDLLAVWYYNRHAEWKYIWRLIPAAVIGVVVATVVGDFINETVFNQMIAWVILISLVLLVYIEFYPPKKEKMDQPIIAWMTGLFGGFCTMISNTAGPVMNIFLLSTGLPKNAFLGTAAYFFMLINIIKLPFHIFAWGTINQSSIWLNFWAIPAILIGFFVGVRIVGYIPEKAFRYFVILVTAIVVVRLLLT